jgi:hypothetical protein
MPRDRITQVELEPLESVLEMGDRHLRLRMEEEQRWLAKLRQGAVIEPGELDLEVVEERAVGRRLKGGAAEKSSKSQAR